MVQFLSKPHFFIWRFFFLNLWTGTRNENEIMWKLWTWHSFSKDQIWSKIFFFFKSSLLVISDIDLHRNIHTLAAFIGKLLAFYSVFMCRKKKSIAITHSLNQIRQVVILLDLFFLSLSVDDKTITRVELFVQLDQRFTAQKSDSFTRQPEKFINWWLAIRGVCTVIKALLFFYISLQVSLFFRTFLSASLFLIYPDEKCNNTTNIIGGTRKVLVNGPDLHPQWYLHSKMDCFIISLLCFSPGLIVFLCFNSYIKLLIDLLLSFSG